MLTGWDSNKKVRIAPGAKLIPAALSDITLPIHLTSSSGLYGKDMAAMFSDLDPVDPHWSLVSLAMPMSGVNGSTSFPDISSLAHAVSVSGPVISTSQHLWGSSGYFDGVNGGLTVNYHTSFDLSTSDFTISAWVYVVAVGASTYTYPAIVSKRSAGADWDWGLWLAGSSNPGVFFCFGDGALGNNYCNAIPATNLLNRWAHIEATRSGNTVRLFVDGVLIATKTISGNIRNRSTAVTVGKSLTDGYFKGYICDLEVTKGVARHIADFTPPTRSIATTTPTYTGLNPLAKKIALEIGNTGVEVPISILTQDWDNTDNTAESAKIYAVFGDLGDGDDFTLYWDSTHADNTNVTEISSAPAAPGSGDALTVWNLASADDLWLIATEFYTISGTVTVSAVAAARRVVVFDESRIYQSFFSDASDGSYGCFVPSTGPFNVALIGNAGEYPKIFSGVTAG